MTLETTSTLTDDTVDHLQTLARVNIDSRDGFLYAVEKLPASATALRELFSSAATERDKQATALSTYVEMNHEEAPKSGSVAASLHRSLLSFRDLFTSDHDPYAILAEAERGEDVIKHAYEDALKATAGSAVTDVLNHQYAAVKKTHDRVRDLRDSFKNK